jgi:hypothetical protein
MNNFDAADLIFSFNFKQKMADKVTKICMDIHRKLEKSRVLNIIERLQIPNILEIIIYIIYNENMSKNIYQSRHRFFCLYHLSLNAIEMHVNAFHTKIFTVQDHFVLGSR